MALSLWNASNVMMFSPVPAPMLRRLVYVVLGC
jgi:hypothetical protein